MHRRGVVVFVALAVTLVVGEAAALLDRVNLAVAIVLLLFGAGAVLMLLVHRRTTADLTARLVAAQKRESADHEAVMRHLNQVEAGLERLDADVRAVRRSVATIGKLTRAARPGMLLTELQALDQLRERFDVDAPLPEVGGWALDPSALLWLVDEIQRRRPTLVVECGSGTSTFWIAMALRQNGHGHVVALDHLEEFAGRTRAVLARHELSGVAEVRHAPLVETETPRGVFPWYRVDPAALGVIDLLIVDGPPESTGRLARYPALPVLHKALAPQSWILADDVHRSDEREAISHWLEEFGDLRRVGHTNANSELLVYG